MGDLIAFTSSIPLSINRFHSQSLHTHSSSCPTRTTTNLSLSTSNSSKTRAPSPSRQGKRVATFRKLQTRHRSGPASFRQKASKLVTKQGIVEINEKEDKSIKLERKIKKDRNIDVWNNEPKKKLKELKLGEGYKGIVRNTLKYGAYIDINSYKDGLCHIRDMSIDFVHEVEDILRPKDKVFVYIKYVDPVKNILGLTMIKPILGFKDKKININDLSINDRLNGVIQRITNYGAYIDIGYDKLAFIHFKSLWGKNQRDTLWSLKLGQQIYVQITDLNTIKNYISLSARGRNGVQLNENIELEKPTSQDQSMTQLESELIQRKALLRTGETLDDGYENGSVTTDDDDGEEEDDDGDDEFNLSPLEDQLDINALSKGMSDSDDYHDEDEIEDEFGFAKERLEPYSYSHDDGDDEGKNIDYSEIAHMVDEDTEFVGLDASEIKRLKNLKSQIQSLE